MKQEAKAKKKVKYKAFFDLAWFPKLDFGS